AKDANSTRIQRLLFLNLAAQEKWPQARAAAEKFFAMDVAADRNNRFTATDYTTYADVLKKLGEDSLAVMQVEKAYEANPDKTDLLKDLSSAYYNAKDYAKAAQAYQQFVDAGTYKTNDLYVLAGRYMTLAASLPQDSPEKAQAVENALKNVDAVLAKVPDDYRIAQRKARIYVVANNNTPSLQSTDVYGKVLEILDADPTNVDKHVDDYREAYNMIATYYIQQHDNANAKVYYNKMLELDPTNDALRSYIENLKD
ncbi:MAG: hypothetical protein K2M76_03635, partial [Muribaculaceae bacterium]|nr:hypothetical protein [Muribaculaceae bacterium]